MAPTSIILGEVSGGNSDNTFQLGGTGSGSFNASQIGDTVISQYRGFSIFNKIDDSVWTLSGLGTQNWTITGGRLIGDTDSLQGPAITNNAALAFNQDFDGIYRGHIAGTGSLTKNGTGTVIVSDENSYSGGTVINAGTLQLGNGGGAGSIIGNVVNNATLAFNRSDVVTFGGVISGGGAVLHNGSGSTILTAVSTYTGATTVNAGILRVDGSVASSNVIVNGGGTLGGTGTVGNVTVNSGATLAPGNSIGTLRINGNLMLGADAIYRVELSPTAADLADVTGTATLGGTAQLVFGPGSYVARSYTVLSAAGGRSGVFGAVTTESLPATLSATVSYTATDVQVTLTSQLAPTPGSPTSPGPPTAPGSPTSPASPGSPAAPTPSLTLNQFAVATAQDIAFNSGQPSVTALFFVPLAQLPTALDRLSGEAHPTTMGVLVDEALYARSAVLGRLRQASYRGNSSMASLALGGPQTSFGDRASESAPADAKSPIVTKAPMRAPEASRDIVFWALGFGGWGRFNGDGNAASVQRDLAGFITGLDAGVGEAGRAGIAAGYTGSRAALHGRGSVSVETGHAAAYGGWSFGALNLRAGGIYAFHSIDTDRTIAFAGFFDRAFARYDGRSGQVFGEAGYGIAFAGIAIEPFAGGAWVRLDTDAAAERGGAAALNVAAGRFEVGYSTFGVRAAGVAPVGDGVMLIPRASLAWQHAFGSVTPEGRLVLANSGVPFAVSGVPIARDSLLAEAGLDLTIGRNATLGASYTGQLARNVHDHAAKGKFSWRF